MMIGERGVARLAEASVAVFGLGGVGSYVAEALARAGIGRLVLVDGDAVTATNRNRQLAALCSTEGQPKAAVMAERIRDIHPGCCVEPHVLFYRPASETGGQSGYGLVDGCDFVADAIDMVSAKIALVEECSSKNIPLISAMGCGNKWDPSRFRVADLSKTSICPLCRVMRRELRARGILHLPVVFSDEPPVLPPDGGRVPGSLSFVPGAAGLILAGEIVKRLLEGNKDAEIFS